MRLLDLEPELVRHVREFKGLPHVAPAGGKFGDPHWVESLHQVQTIAEADSILFLCPVCFKKNGGSVGTHGVMVTFKNRSLPDGCTGSVNDQGQQTRWDVGGTGLHDLTLKPSIDLTRGGKDPGEWHGFITAGQVT